MIHKMNKTKQRQLLMGLHQEAVSAFCVDDVFLTIRKK